MRNTASHHVVEGATSHQALVPTPSNSSADPLNWSMKQFNATEATVSLFLGVCVITLGYSNFFIIQFSNIFGQRAACLVTDAIVISSI